MQIRVSSSWKGLLLEGAVIVTSRADNGRAEGRVSAMLDDYHQEDGCDQEDDMGGASWRA